MCKQYQFHNTTENIIIHAYKEQKVNQTMYIQIRKSEFRKYY